MMNTLQLVVLGVMVFAFTSCSTVRVAADYDRQADFSSYKTFAFFKPGIDKAEVSDLDKKRILRAIEAQLTAKGFSKSSDPDMLVSIFTKTKENINVYNNNFGYGGLYGWGWSPWFWNTGYNTVSSTTEGTLYIDFIDGEKKELVWQGMGTSALVTTGNIEKKEERINEIVAEIIARYPPGSYKK